MATTWLTSVFPRPSQAKQAEIRDYILVNNNFYKQALKDGPSYAYLAAYYSDDESLYDYYKYLAEAELAKAKSIVSGLDDLLATIPLYSIDGASVSATVKAWIPSYFYLALKAEERIAYSDNGDANDQESLSSIWNLYTIYYGGGNDSVTTENTVSEINVALEEGNDTYRGGSGTDRVNGGIGNDSLAGFRGIDVLDGGEGDDSVDGGIGDDLIAGGIGNDFLLGNAGDDLIFGDEGNDRINGGMGIDIMKGGIGDDSYVVDNVRDVVTEAASAGTDTVQSSITHALAVNVENLTLTGAAAINCIGNALNNVLKGNSAANILNGGFGDDTYVIGAGDTVAEALNSGTDTVQSSITHTLRANTENLVLRGTEVINGTGNTLNNRLTGNAANNILNGATGEDVMAGGLGNDTYIVDNIKDVVSEGVDAGLDTVKSSVTHTLRANTENPGCPTHLSREIHATASCGV